MHPYLTLVTVNSRRTRKFILHVSARQQVRSHAAGSNAPASHHQFATITFVCGHPRHNAQGIIGQTNPDIIIVILKKALIGNVSGVSQWASQEQKHCHETRNFYDDAGEYQGHHELESEFVIMMIIIIIITIIIIIIVNNVIIMMQGSPLTSPSTYIARRATCLGGKGGLLMSPWTTPPSASSMLSCSTGGPHVTA